MILTGHEIRNRVRRKQIIIQPFDYSAVNPNSYDLRLGPTLVSYTDAVIDVRKQPNVVETAIPTEGYVLRAGSFYLGSSIEVVGSEHFVPMLHAKSGIARLGLFVHVTADLIDIGSVGQITFQLLPSLDLRVFAGMRIGQVSFWRPHGPIHLYSGKYQGSVGPQPSRISEGMK